MNTIELFSYFLQYMYFVEKLYTAFDGSLLQNPYFSSVKKKPFINNTDHFIVLTCPCVIFKALFFKAVKR